MSVSNSLPSANSHFISVQQAASMTARYRSNREIVLATTYKEQDILAFSETFNRDVFDTLLSKEGCAGLRIYYGMDEDLKVHAILVAVDESNADILPEQTLTQQLDPGDDVGEEGHRCPNVCPPSSPLNS